VGKDQEIRRLIEEWFPDASGEEVGTLVKLFIVAADALPDEETSEPS
jgi:hypothetical protein